MTDLLAFTGVSATFIVTPGPDTALTVRNAVWRGRRSGLATAVGVAIGQLSWGMAVAAGFASLLREWPTAFTALRLTGAFYLAYLGTGALRDAWRDRSPARPAVGRAPGGHPASLLQGLMSNLSNPKMGVFFLTLLPQFATGRQSTPVQLLTLVMLFAAMTLTWLAGYCWVVDRVGDVLRRARPRRVLDAASGAALIALGARTVFD